MTVKVSRVFRDLPKDERELFWLEQAERALKELRENYASRRQSYAFLTEPLGELVRERITLVAVVSGIPEARNARETRKGSR